MVLVLVLVGVLLLSAWGTGLLRRYALNRSVLDVPNERSSHSVPTPRGGGVAIVGAFLLAVLVLRAERLVDLRTAAAIAGAGTLVALIGFLDDHGSIGVRWRLMTHFVAAALAVFFLGGLPPLSLFGSRIDLGVCGNVLAVVALVWLLNLYNFMDGIDGIAGVEAVSVCLAAAVLYSVALVPEAEVAVPLTLAAAVLGFLVWNFPPAKIFMGDAGSGFLGLILGVLAIHGASLSPTFIWGWLILVGAFVVDATVTLVRRMQQGERLYEAHRTHAYQHAAILCGQHLPVTVAIALINLFWLLPWAMLVGLDKVSPLIGICFAYLPLVLLALWLNAGSKPRSLSTF